MMRFFVAIFVAILCDILDILSYCLLFCLIRCLDVSDYVVFLVWPFRCRDLKMFCLSMFSLAPIKFLSILGSHPAVRQCEKD